MQRRVLVLAMMLLAVVARGQEPSHAADQRRLREIYRELVETNTTHSTGTTTRAAAAVAKRLKAAGFAAADMHLLGPTPDKQNLVVRYRGRGAAKPLLLLAHLDVVEAKRDDWSLDPFRLTERDGFFYGRGTLDDKAMAAIFIEIMLRMKGAHRVPSRDVILALTADEEGGPDNGVEWLLREHRELVDAAMVLNEGGGGRSRAETYLFNGVQASEKSYMSYQLEVRDKGGHSSLPTKENAIYRLAEGLTRLARHQFPVELSEVTRGFFTRMAEIEQGPIAADVRAILQDPPDPAAVQRVSEMPSYNAMLRTTCVATRLEGGHADNALPQLARAVVNCRILPGHSTTEVQRELANVLQDEKIVVAPTEPDTSGPASPLDPTFLQAVEKTTSEFWPGLPVVPTMSSGASDSRFFRMAGIPAYGVSGIFVDMDDIRAHRRDERVGVKQFYDGAEFLWRLVTALSS